MRARKPVWTTASFLLYAGGLLVLFSAAYALSYLSSSYGKVAFVGWSALVFVVLLAIAVALKRGGSFYAAGIFAFSAVVGWAVLVGSIESWWGWLSNTNSPFAGFHVGDYVFMALVIVAALLALVVFRFPFISAIAFLFVWLLVASVISNGGTWTAWVSIFVGLFYLLVGVGLGGRPTGFWAHVASGLLIGGSLLHWWHATDADWALICVVALVFVAVARLTKRSSWAVLAVLGLLAAASHFAVEWTLHGGVRALIEHHSFRPWAPALVFAITGFLIVALGMLVAGRPQPDAAEPAAPAE